VNGVSLLGQSNIDAMETLRHAMHNTGPEPGSISIAVARPTAPAADAAAGVAMATNDAVGKTPCLRQTASSTGHLSRGLMPPPSTTKVLSSRKSLVGLLNFSTHLHHHLEGGKGKERVRNSREGRKGRE